jgi:hypothetical protein
MSTQQTFIVTALHRAWGTITKRVEAASHADAVAEVAPDATQCKPWGQPTAYTLAEWAAKMAQDSAVFGGLNRMTEGGGASTAEEEQEGGNA